MSNDAVNGILTQLRRGTLPGDSEGRTDGDLLGDFVERRDEAAFEALVRRHGSMVFGVCRRILGHQQDAEDAFQATFVVLARKAPSVVPRDVVGNWLYGVAYQTAVRAQALNLKRLNRERQVAAMPDSESAADSSWNDVRPVLDEEMARLPNKYRAVIVLCDVEGRTRKDAAEHVGCPEGSVSSRLSRARTMLAKRLARRGIVLTAAAIAALVAERAGAAVPPALVGGTLKSAGLGVTGSAATAGGVSATVDILAKGVMGAMAMKKTLVVMVLVLAAVLAVSGLGLGTRYLLSNPAQPPPDAKAATASNATGGRTTRTPTPPAPKVASPPPATTRPAPPMPPTPPVSPSQTEPNVVLTYTPATGPARFAVVGEDVPGTIIIVLDWSLSMGYNQDTLQKHDRWGQAKEALRTVLSELPPDTVVGVFRSNGNTGDDGTPSPLEMVLAPMRHGFANAPAALDNFINSLPFADGKTSPVARWVKDAVKDRAIFKTAVGAKTLLVLTDGADNVTADPFGVIRDALRGSDVSLKIALFNDGKVKAEQNDLKKATELFKGMRRLNPPGDYWQAEQRGELIEAMKKAMRPQIRVLRENGEIEAAIHDANQHGMQALPLREKLIGWSPPIPRGAYRISASGIDQTLLLLNPGDRALPVLVVKNGKLAFQPFRYADFIVPQSHPHLKARDDRNLVQLAMPRVVLVPNKGGSYDLELLILMDREFRGGTDLQIERPQFVWFEVRPGVNAAPLRAITENVNYYPSPAWRVRVPNWPYKTNALIDAAPPSVTAWWLDTFPSNAQILTRDRAVLLENDFRKSLRIDGVDVTVERVGFNDANQLEVQVNYPKGKPCPLLVRALNLKENPRYEQAEQHSFFDNDGRYVARFGPVTAQERQSVFSLEFQSMKEMRDRAQKVELNLNFSPTDRNPLQQVPGPKTD